MKNPDYFKSSTFTFVFTFESDSTRSTTRGNLRVDMAFHVVSVSTRKLLRYYFFALLRALLATRRLALVPTLRKSLFTRLFAREFWTFHRARHLLYVTAQRELFVNRLQTRSAVLVAPPTTFVIALARGPLTGLLTFVLLMLRIGRMADLQCWKW